MVQLKRANEVTEAEATMVANRMRGVRRLYELQCLVEELSESTTETQFLNWLQENSNEYIMRSIKAIEVFYIDGVHPSIEAIDVTISVLKDFRGEILSAA